jgi:hypothetical protein
MRFASLTYGGSIMAKGLERRLEHYSHYKEILSLEDSVKESYALYVLERLGQAEKSLPSGSTYGQYAVARVVWLTNEITGLQRHLSGSCSSVEAFELPIKLQYAIEALGVAVGRLNGLFLSSSYKEAL